MPPAREVDDFFEAECKSFLGAAILYFALHMPEEHRSLGTLRDMVSGLRSDQTRSLIEDMSRPDLDPMIMNRMRSFHGKDMGKSVSRLSDTLDTVLKLFDNRGIREVTSRSDFSFAELKKEPATVYITIPFQRIKSHGRYVTMLLNMALDALESSQRPQIPVLMLFDEFLSFPRSDTILSALRTHAGAGVRMWFFLQDINALAHIYPNNWKSFLQAEVECYFGTDDHFTAKMVSEFLGTTTRVVVGGNASGTTGSGNHYSYNESPQLVQSDLMTPTDVERFMAYPPSHLVLTKSRNAIYRLRGATLQARISPYTIDPIAKDRFGSMLDEE